MEGIIKRLFESKSSPQHLSTDIFNIKNNSSEAWDLYGDINDAVAGVVKGYDPDIDLDDSGLDSRGSTDGDRTIIYITVIGRYDSTKSKSTYSSPVYNPIKPKEKNMFIEELSKLITLPESDDEYYYSVKVEIEDTTLSITLRREQK